MLFVERYGRGVGWGRWRRSCRRDGRMSIWGGRNGLSGVRDGRGVRRS